MLIAPREYLLPVNRVPGLAHLDVYAVLLCVSRLQEQHVGHSQSRRFRIVNIGSESRVSYHGTTVRQVRRMLVSIDGRSVLVGDDEYLEFNRLPIALADMITTILLEHEEKTYWRLTEDYSVWLTLMLALTQGGTHVIQSRL